MGASHWLSILGIGEDGIEGLSGRARALVAGAELVVGGARHLGLAAELIASEAMVWPRPIEAGVEVILGRRGAPVVVLASGDPMFHGVGSMLARVVEPGEFLCLPVASCVSLAAARLGWALQETVVVSCCGWPVERVVPYLHHGARLLVLSADAGTPGAVADLLTARGFGGSVLHVMEALGGVRERHRVGVAEAGVAEAGVAGDVAALNLVAVEVVAGVGARVVALGAGRADDGFGHDGQMTKSEVRAVTLAALRPGPGAMLWDVGCGSGSVAIEWLLSGRGMRAVGFERDVTRAGRARQNAVGFGVGLEVRVGEAPAVLGEGLGVPDAVFVGGGATGAGVIEACWGALRVRGRLVVNAVTIETEAALVAAHGRFGGTMTRIGVERLDLVGRFHGFRPAMRVTQWVVVKS